MSGKVIRLYHGSKSGIMGNIDCYSLKCNDFGSGFYMYSNIKPAVNKVYLHD